MKKYELTNKKTDYWGSTLYRIRALIDFANVKAGDIGGWIEKEDNLSHRDNCWVYGNGIVCDNGLVRDNGMVCDNGIVCDNGVVCDNGLVGGCGIVCDGGVVCENGLVRDNGKVYDNGMVFGNGIVCDNGLVRDNGVVCDNGMVYGYGIVSSNGMVRKPLDILITGPTGSRNDFTTFYKTADGGIGVTCGCFTGTLDEFLEAVEKTHGDNKKFRSTYKKLADAAKSQILGVID